MQHLQKTEGWGCSSHSGTYPPLGVNLSFQSLTHCTFYNPFVFTFMHVMGGCTPWRFYSPNPPLALRRGISPVRILPSLLPYIFASLLPSSLTIAALPSR